MFKKTLACFISALIILLPLESYAEELEGRVTSLSLNEEAPYAGVLLDPIAASKMIVDQRYLRSEIELQLRKELQQDLSNKRLAFDLLKVEHDSLQKIHKEITLLKDQQVSDLNLLLKEEMGNDYTEWWVMGGVVIGIFLSVAVFYASVEVVK
tara:strand:- start:604 stop:1062 length:459 start_codon:yes stop_codon:yes gene_type:complete